MRSKLFWNFGFNYYIYDMKRIKDLSEISYWVLKKLYSLRFPDDQTVPFEEYVGRYRFISVKERDMEDDTAYAAEDEIWRKKCWKEGNHIETLTIPNAVIYNGVVIKNRYGYESSTEFLDKERMNIINKANEENATS